jgi:iron complex transport system ATP-binding protein
VNSLAAVAADPETPATVLVTHHTDEIPPGFTHGLLLRGGAVIACGALDQILTAESLSKCFGLSLRLEKRDDRWLSWATS